MSDHIRYIPGMPWRLVDGVRLPDLDAIRACPFPTPYTFSQFGARPRLNCGETLTQQEFKDECDINVIMRRYARSGQLPQLNLQGVYGDFSEVPDYMEALNTVLHAQESFSDLPSELRERFNHNPGALLQFLGNPSNREEAIKLGLVNAPSATPPAPPQRSDPPTNDPTNAPGAKQPA